MLKRTLGTAVSFTPVPAQNTLAASLGAAMNANNQGVYRMDVKRNNPLQFPKSTNFTAVNSNADGAAQKTVYIFNEDTYTANVTGGTNLVSKAYNDGFTGKNINRMLTVANNGNGLTCVGFNIIYKDASGNQDMAALETAEFTIQSYNGIGGKPIPEVLDLTEALRNNSFQQGLLTIDCEFDIAALSQVTCILPKGYTVSVNFKWAPVNQY
jgi:hypothetical protein